MIEVMVTGLLKRDFFEVIRQTLREINEGFSNNLIRETIACNCAACRSSDAPHFHDYQKLLAFFAKGSRHWPCPQSEEMIPIAQLLGDVLGAKESELETIINLLRELKSERDTPGTLFQKTEKLAAFARITGVTLRELIKLSFGL